MDYFHTEKCETTTEMPAEVAGAGGDASDAEHAVSVHVAAASPASASPRVNLRRPILITRLWYGAYR